MRTVQIPVEICPGQTLETIFAKAAKRAFAKEKVIVKFRFNGVLLKINPKKSPKIDFQTIEKRYYGQFSARNKKYGIG